MTEKISADAQLSWRLDTDCPYCDEGIDLADCGDSEDFARAIFGNNWGALKGVEVVCPHCKEDFLIGEVEY